MPGVDSGTPYRWPPANWSAGVIASGPCLYCTSSVATYGAPYVVYPPPPGRPPGNVSNVGKFALGSISA